MVLNGLWFLHSINLQNEDVAAGEEGMVFLQWGTDAWDPNRTWHAREIGNVREGAPMIVECGFPVKGQVLVGGRVNHLAAASHKVTVLAWKLRDR